MIYFHLVRVPQQIVSLKFDAVVREGKVIHEVKTFQN